MPFTPIHMGPGILIKAILQSSFSLMVFGWTQIVMDIQPLIVLITGEGHLHGFTHTYFGATLLAFFSALTGKYLSELGLKILGIDKYQSISIAWRVAFLSAFIGSFSHVFLDSIMHTDVEPFYPITLTNDFLGMVSITMLHKLCMYSGGVGALIYFAVNYRAFKT
ncbi:metal-dependent hydrolase [Alkalimarinus sediminis]|uniref:Metal-dependent hydrolase n=1 Tax=Alkalimarinus sediminis TaxID=1632866 RepID=A0A9E8HJI2_9ALTE|nr:metal-dependent hydrolase [Alkalimarinus sediminis]UZW74502.1 metal-dependent hydrolase [Alkalimarinus sediminis]